MKLKNKKVLLILSASFLLFGCGNSGGSNPPTPPTPTPTPDPEITLVDATKIYTTSNVSTFALNGTRTIKPVLFPNNAKKNVKFTSSDISVLSPDENGVVTGVGLGTATIVAYNDNNENNQYDEGEPKTHVVYTIVNPDSTKTVTLPENERNVTIEVDQVLELHPSISGGITFLSAYSNNSDVCEALSVSTSLSKIKGVKAGTSVISIYSGTAEAKCNVTVIDKVDDTGVRASHIEIEKPVINLVVGEVRDITEGEMYTIYPTESVDHLNSVISNDTQIVSSNYHRMTAKKAGSTYLTYETANGKTVKQRVVVTDPSISHEETYYNDYYGDLTWENGEDLKQKLHDLIDDNATLIYDGNWDSNRAADQDLYNYSEVDALYTSSNYLKTEQNTKWNREHSIPATKMTALNTGATNYVGRATDFHNLFAADKDDNSSHGNRDFGFTDPTSLEYIQREDCSRQGDIFEPEQDEDKGKLARAVMYMAVRYDEVTPLSFKEKNSANVNVDFTVNQAPVELVDDNVGYNRFKFTDFDAPSGEGAIMYANYLIDEVREDNPEATDEELKELAYTKYLEDYSPYSSGNLKDLLMWNSYPVTLGEYQHNESVYTKVVPAKEEGSTVQKAQGNRNPFVDYPELAEYVFGSLQNQAGSLKNLTPSYLALEMNKDELHHYAFTGETPTFEVGDELDVTKLNIKAIKNDLSEMTLDPTDLSVEPHTFTEDDVASGYTANVTTSKNTLHIKVEVVGDTPSVGDVTYDTCSYQSGDILSGDYSFGEGISSCVISKSGTSFTVTSGIKDPYLRNNSTKGCQIGKGSPDNVGTLSYVTTSAVENVNGVFFKIGTAANKSYHYVVKVGAETILEGDTDSADNKEYGISFAENLYSGIISIEFSNVSAAIYVKGIAYNVVD